jgi:hypothetical protein
LGAVVVMELFSQAALTGTAYSGTALPAKERMPPCAVAQRALSAVRPMWPPPSWPTALAEPSLLCCGPYRIGARASVMVPSCAQCCPSWTSSASLTFGHSVPRCAARLAHTRTVSHAAAAVIWAACAAASTTTPKGAAGCPSCAPMHRLCAAASTARVVSAPPPHPGVSTQSTAQYCRLSSVRDHSRLERRGYSRCARRALNRGLLGAVL